LDFTEKHRESSPPRAQPVSHYNPCETPQLRSVPNSMSKLVSLTSSTRLPWFSMSHGKITGPRSRVPESLATEPPSDPRLEDADSNFKALLARNIGGAAHRRVARPRHCFDPSAYAQPVVSQAGPFQVRHEFDRRDSTRGSLDSDALNGRR
jgi:hypothetical protein